MQARPSRPHVVDDERTWSAVFSWFAREHLLGVLHAAVAEGYICVCEAWRVELENGCDAAAEGFRVIQEAALVASAALQSEAVPHRFFKGVAVASLEEFAGRRHATDADVLVQAAMFDRSLSILRSAGFRPHKAEYERRVPAAAMSVNLGRDLGLVDLHRGISVMPFAARIGDRPFSARGATAVLADGELPILDAAALGVVAALEVAFHDRPAKPAAARDAMILARQEPDQIEAVAREWRVEGPTALGLVLAGYHLGVEDQVPDWVTAIDIDRRDIALYRAFEAHARVPYLVHTLLDLPTWSERRTFLSSWIPNRRQLAERGGWRALWRRQLISTREVLRRRRLARNARKKLAPR